MIFIKTLLKVLIVKLQWLISCCYIALTQISMADPQLVYGGFQLEFVSISRIINHMTCYKFECSHWWKIYFYKKILYKRKSCKGFFCKNKFSTNESTAFITGHVGGNLEEELHYFAAKNGWEGWAHLVLPSKTATPLFLRVLPCESP